MFAIHCVDITIFWTPHSQNYSSTKRTRHLARMPGEVYPGSAVLGDSRALTNFMMQRKLCKPGEGETIGWILFASEQLKDATEVEVEFNLADGPERFVFSIPKS